MTETDRIPWRWVSSMRVRIVAVVVILLLFSSIGSVLLLRIALFDQLDEEIGASLERESEEFRLLAGGTDPRTGEPFDDDLTAIFDVYFSREVADEGETLLAFIDDELYQTRRAQAVPDPDEYRSAIDYWLSLEEAQSGVIDTPAGPTQYTVLPLTGVPNNGMFVVANFPAFERSEIDNAVQTQVVVQLATTAVASLLGLALAGRVLRPLRSLATTARRISDTDLTQRIEVRARDEASQIADAFNDMLARLEASFTTQRQFLDDTSHELRSPLTVIRGHIELMEFDESPADRAKTIALVTDEIDRMNQIVSDLFLLARADRPDFCHFEPVDLHELILTAHQKMTALAPRDWQVQEPPRVVITADRNRLTQALLQLADNAVKHAGEGATIELGADVTDGRARIWVADSGPGVSAGDAEEIFARFTRGRNESPHSMGAGLGLSIVSAIAQAHGGSVALVSPTGGGARFEITLPRNR